MEIYHYDPETGRFMASGEADESPLEKGVYLIPAHATSEEPPPYNQATEIPVWRNGAWEIDALPEAPVPTDEQVKTALVAAVQAHLDATAQAMDYDNIFTAVTYADEPAVPEFQAEGQALRAWRSLVWATCAQVLADVQADKRGVPTVEDLIAELPAFVAP